MNILFLILIGISLSMDTFSISLSLGTFGLGRKHGFIYSILVGTLHFIMPFIGCMLGFYLKQYIYIESNLLLGVILLFIAVEMIWNLKSSSLEIKKINFLSMFLLAISVSLDSLTVGLGLSLITSHIIVACLIFSITSFIFTVTGLTIGTYAYNMFGKKSSYIGIAILVILALIQLFK